MTELRRLPVKYIRDSIKKEYIKDDRCYICGSADELELHHLYSLSQMWNTWLEKNRIKEVTTVEQINELRIIFSKEHKEKLDNSQLYTLCQTHHKRLHNIYGATFSNAISPKILRWLNIQKSKFMEE